MAQTAESLRQELQAARDKVQRQIDKLRALPDPYPFDPDRPAGGRLPRAPWPPNEANVGNDDLIAKLTRTLQEIDDSLADLENHVS